MSGSPKALAPVRTESGLVVRAAASLNDLVAFTPKTQTQWVVGLAGHVPGQILTLRAFGNVIMVTTSERPAARLLRPGDPAVAARPGRDRPGAAGPGLRRSTWSWSTWPARCAGSPSPPARSVWQHSLGADVTVSPAVGAGLVVAMDRGGTVTALDAATGRAPVDRGAGGQGRRGSSAAPWWCCRTRPPTGWTRPPATGAGCGPSSARSPSWRRSADRLVLATAERDGAARRGRAGDRPGCPATCGSRSPTDRMVGWGADARPRWSTRPGRSAGAGRCPT